LPCDAAAAGETAAADTLERRYVFMSANSLYKDSPHGDKTSKNEWRILPTEPSVARSSIVEPVSDQRPATPATDTDTQHCRYCTETLPPGARECPLCLREVADHSPERRARLSQPASAISRPPTDASLRAATISPGAITTVHGAATARGRAVYTLESPVQCPECDSEITTIHVIRVVRTQVSFTSTLPRKAYVIACPACRKLVSAGLSGLF
jgi:hypothetical protein